MDFFMFYNYIEKKYDIKKGLPEYNYSEVFRSLEPIFQNLRTQKNVGSLFTWTLKFFIDSYKIF